MIRRHIAMATSATVATVTLLGTSPAATAAPLAGPWGPPQVLHNGRSAETIAHEVTVTWSKYYREGIVTRQLATVG